MRWRSLNLLLGFILSFAFAGLLYGQRAGRGIITGLVIDPAGAAVPDATVTVTDQVTQFKTVVGSSSDGNYGTPLLPLGTYKVQVEKPGFKTYIREGIEITGGATYRQDVTLELGAVTQTVEVKAASEMINVQTADVSHTLNQRYYQDLPIVMGTDIRLAESMLYAQPGFVPTTSGDPMFRGSGFNSRLNGGQTMSVESFIDGAAFGYVNGHNETHESTPPVEAIAEMRVDTGSFSAQYGHTSGGFIEYTTKSGTNQFHGSIYEYLGNRSLNARGFYPPNRVPFQNNSYGITAGGPIVIPGLYNGKNRTYVFGNLDMTNLRTGVATNYDNTVPTTLMRSANFSELLSYGTTPGVNVGTDILGRPIFQGEIFDPSSTRLVTADVQDPGSLITPTASGYVRDGVGFSATTGLPITGQANIVSADTPGAYGLLSGIAGRINVLQPAPQIAGVGNNHLGTSFGDPNGKLDPKTFLLRVDHQISSSVKMYTTWYQNSRPAIRNCNGPQACDTSHDPIADSASNTDYIGPGFYQRISVRVLHQQFDWVIKPNLFNHTTIGFDRWYMGQHSLSEGVGWNQVLGLKQSNGDSMPLYGADGKAGGFPTLNWGGGLVPAVASDGTGWVRGFETTNRWQFLDDISWIKGRHTIKAGAEYRHHQTPQDGWGRSVMGTWNFATAETGGIAAAGNILADKTGDAYASFLLGQVDNANTTLFTPNTWYEAYTAAFINDEFKVTSKLSLTFGLRYDYMFPRHEAADRYSSFDPAAVNPGSPGVLGAMAFAGTGTGRTGKRTFENPATNDWGPRFGFAYRLTNKDVIRGGYGMYYAGISFNYSQGYPDVGASSTYPQAPNLTGGIYPAFYWDYATTCPQAGVGCGFPSAAMIPPPVIDPTIANGGQARGVRSDALNLPRYQNITLAYERQLSDNTSLEVAYVGNRGTRLGMNGLGLGLGSNMSNPDLTPGVAALTAGVNTTEGQAALAAEGITTTDPATGRLAPFAGFEALYFPGHPSVAQALRPYPQYSSVYWRSGFPGGYSTYHSVQTKLDRRFSNGLQLRVSYTWSRLINNGAENGLLWGVVVQNPVNVAAERGLSADDVPHVVTVTYTYALPFGKGRRWVNQGGAVNQVIGGWHVAGIHRYSSGRPIDVTMDDGTLGGITFNNQHRPNRLSGGGWGGGKFDPAVDRYYSTGGWADPGGAGLTFGNAPRTDNSLRDFPSYNEDLNVFKEFPIRHEDVKIRFETQFGNAFNRHWFCTPNTSWDSGAFGQVSAMCNQPRHVDFGLKLYW
jgi:hypothetical protein